MNGIQILDQYRNELAEQLSGLATPTLRPLDINPWLAMSLLQKSIRRSRVCLALGAGAALLEGSPERLWRRLCVTAFEDIGVADFETVAMVTAGLKGKRWRESVGGDWVVASYLINRMCEANKCRAVCDLLMVAECHPDYERSRLDLTFKPLPQLMKQCVGQTSLPAKTLAMWYAVGTYRCPSPALRERRGDYHSAFDFLCNNGFPDTLIEICREGFKKSGDNLCAFLPFVWQEFDQVDHRVKDDLLPPEELIRGIPCWAFDMHVREGNQAMSMFLKTDCETTRWINSHIPSSGRRKFLGNILFCVESGLVTKRLQWNVGTNLRHMADYQCHGVDPLDISEVMELLHHDLPRLNEARCHVANSKP